MPSTILAVDDSATMRKALEITFAGTDFRLLTCDNANAAVEKVKTERPDLVIADVSLPPTDGYALCNTIKLASPGLPVLMLSSRHNPFDPAKGAQADDHIDKPFDTQTLIDKARALIEAGVSKVAPAAAQVAAAAPMAEAAQAAAAPAPAAQKPPTPQAPPAAAQPSPAVGRRTKEPGGGRRAPMKTMRFDPAAHPGGPEQAPGDRAKLMKTLAFPAKGAPPEAPAEGASPTPGPAGPRPAPPARPPKRPPIATLPGAVAPGDETTPPRQPGVEPLELREEPLPEPPPPGQRPTPSPTKAAARATVPSWPSPGQKPEPEEKGRSGPPPLPGAAAKAPEPAAEPAKPAAAAAPAAEVALPADLNKRLEGVGLTADQIKAVVALSREVLEQVVWEVVPTLAETMIKEEIARLTKD